MDTEEEILAQRLRDIFWHRLDDDDIIYCYWYELKLITTPIAALFGIHPISTRCLIADNKRNIPVPVFAKWLSKKIKEQ